MDGKILLLFSWFYSDGNVIIMNIIYMEKHFKCKSKFNIFIYFKIPYTKGKRNPITKNPLSVCLYVSICHHAASQE